MITIQKADVLIIGAGPVGLFSSFQAGLLGMSAIVVDALEEVGGQLTALYPEKYIFDIPAYPKILAKDLIAKLVEQSKPYNPTYLLNQKITSMQKTTEGFKVLTTKNIEIEAKAIIIAAGAGAFGPNRPPVKDIESYENKSVFYSVKNPKDFEGKTVVIAGGGDSAVDWAITLAEGISKKVYLVHRRENFRALPASVEKLKNLANTNVLELVIPFMPKDIKGENGYISEVIVSNANEEKTIKADCFIPFFGLTRSLGGLEHWGLEIDKINSQINVQQGSFETNIKGVFAVGDIAKYNHKLKLIMTGFAEAASALHCAWDYVFPNKPFRFVHSTSKG